MGKGGTGVLFSMLPYSRTKKSRFLATSHSKVNAFIMIEGNSKVYNGSEWFVFPRHTARADFMLTTDSRLWIGAIPVGNNGTVPFDKSEAKVEVLPFVFEFSF